MTGQSGDIQTSKVPSKYLVITAGLMCGFGVLLGTWRERQHPSAGRPPAKLAIYDRENPVTWRESDGTAPPRGAWRAYPDGKGDATAETWLPSFTAEPGGSGPYQWVKVATAPEIGPGETVAGVVMMSRKVNNQFCAYIVFSSGRAVGVTHVIPPGD